MILKRLLNVILPIIEEDINKDVEKIYSNISIEEDGIIELLAKSDQEIDDFLKEKKYSEEKQKIIFEVFQKLKIEKAIDNISADLSVDAEEITKKRIMELFSNIVEPIQIEIRNDKVELLFDFTEKSNLRQRLDSIDQWSKDNVVETISKEQNISTENIVVIDNVSSYVEFISNLDETNYISRGQKDCTYKLIPTLHRIYDNGYKSHSSQYETTFKQKVLYYDNSIDSKDTEELRAYAQHFGLPTNYLDFTEAHLISLLFAVEEFEYIDNHSIVYFIDALSYNRDVIKEEIKLVDFSDKNSKKTKESSYSDKSYFIKVGNSNERIHFQKGCFLKVEPNDNLDMMFQKYTKIVIIDKDHKQNILKELFGLGITFENIYPDKDNMVKTIKYIKEQIN